MATDKIYTPEDIIEINRNYTPMYNPFYLLLKEGKVYNEKPGKVVFKDRGLQGDKKAAEVLAQDTEIKSLSVGEKAPKEYLKFPKGAEYAVSDLQDNSDAQSVDNEVLDEFQKQLDGEIFTGEGTSNTTVKNNGIFFSKDPNFVEKAVVSFPTSFSERKAFIKSLAKESANGAGGGLKRIALLGSKLPAIFGDVIGAGNDTFAELLLRARLAGEPPLEIMVVPNEINLKLKELSSGTEVDGIIVMDYENVLLNHGLLPQVFDKGYEKRGKLTWTQYFYNSAMVDIIKKAALIKQLVTV